MVSIRPCFIKALEQNRRVGKRLSESSKCKAVEAGDVNIVDGGQRRSWAMQPAETSRVLFVCLNFPPFTESAENTTRALW